MLSCFSYLSGRHPDLHSFPTRRSSDLEGAPALLQGRLRSTSSVSRVLCRARVASRAAAIIPLGRALPHASSSQPAGVGRVARSEEHTSELQSRVDLVCRLLLEKKKKL